MKPTSIVLLLQLLVALTPPASAFVTFSPQSRHVSIQLHFGIPTFGSKDDKKDDKKKDDDKKISFSGLIQVITAGMGAPFLGDYEGIDEETGKMMFSLEANNLVDEDGNSKQTKMPYFESGWVDPEDLKKEEARKAGKGGFKFPWD